MPRPAVLAIVMAGGAGNRLEVLTERRAKPAMPYAGVYRLIDFPLSNCLHSGVSDVWIVQQYQPHSLNDHISNGRPWDLDRTHGGLRILPPHRGGTEGGWHQGNADALLRHRPFIEESGAETLLVLSSDHVYKLDYRAVLATHREQGAEVTMVTTEVGEEEARRLGNVEVAEDGRIGGFAYKPEEPAGAIATTEVFVFDARALLRLLAELRDASEEDLEDLGEQVLPALVERGRAYEHRLEGYWRDLGLVQSYWGAHMDLLGAEPKLALDDPRWPILTHGAQRPPARLEATARLDRALVSPGCRVAGAVEHSVLSPGVVVEEGAVVRDSVVLHDTTIERGARVECAVVDMEAVVGEGARVGDACGAPEAADDEIAAVGIGARLSAGAKVGPGARVEPGAQVH